MITRQPCSFIWLCVVRHCLAFYDSQFISLTVFGLIDCVWVFCFLLYLHMFSQEFSLWLLVGCRGILCLAKSDIKKQFLHDGWCVACLIVFDFVWPYVPLFSPRCHFLGFWLHGLHPCHRGGESTFTPHPLNKSYQIDAMLWKKGFGRMPQMIIEIQFPQKHSRDCGRQEATKWNSRVGDCHTWPEIFDFVFVHGLGGKSLVLFSLFV